MNMNNPIQSAERAHNILIGIPSPQDTKKSVQAIVKLMRFNGWRRSRHDYQGRPVMEKTIKGRLNSYLV